MYRISQIQVNRSNNSYRECWYNEFGSHRSQASIHLYLSKGKHIFKGQFFLTLTILYIYFFIPQVQIYDIRDHLICFYFDHLRHNKDVCFSKSLNSFFVVMFLHVLGTNRSQVEHSVISVETQERVLK